MVKMKTTIKLSIMIALMVIISFMNKLHASGKKDTTVLIINGRILVNSDKIKQISKCKVELYNENNLVNSMSIRWQKPFEFKLKENVWYTIRITGDDLIPVMVSFNTATGDKSDVKDLFCFDVEMLTMDQLPFINKDIMEFPVGHVEFNKEKGIFEAREAYTAFYKSNLFIDGETQLAINTK
jgi:hypothetical protein